MDPTELADKLESLDVDSFASLLQLDYTHDDAPAQAKKLIIDALRFVSQHDLASAVLPLTKLTEGSLDRGVESLRLARFGLMRV